MVSFIGELKSQFFSDSGLTKSIGCWNATFTAFISWKTFFVTSLTSWGSIHRVVPASFVVVSLSFGLAEAGGYTYKCSRCAVYAGL